MAKLPILYLIIVFTARNNTAYHPKQLLRKYIEIKNPFIAKVLIRQSDPLLYRGKNRPEYRNRMTLIGLILYIICVLTIILHLVLLKIKTLGPTDHSYDELFLSLHANTINQAIVITSAWIVLVVNVCFMFFNMLTIAVFQKETDGRKLTIGICIMFLVFFLFFIYLQASDLLSLIV